MLSHHRTLIFVFVVGRLFFVHCLQPGHANLGGCLKFFAGLDFEEIMSKKASATLTGRMLRNQLYYEFATFAGVKGAGNNVAAPQYIRAACNAALPYGRDDEIPQVHIDAYKCQDHLLPLHYSFLRRRFRELCREWISALLSSSVPCGCARASPFLGLLGSSGPTKQRPFLSGFCLCSPSVVGCMSTQTQRKQKPGPRRSTAAVRTRQYAPRPQGERRSRSVRPCFEM